MLNNNVTEKKTKDNIVELHMKDPGFSVTEAVSYTHLTLPTILLV